MLLLPVSQPHLSGTVARRTTYSTFFVLPEILASRAPYQSKRSRLSLNSPTASLSGPGVFRAPLTAITQCQSNSVPHMGLPAFQVPPSHPWPVFSVPSNPGFEIWSEAEGYPRLLPLEAAIEPAHSLLVERNRYLASLTYKR